LQLGAKDIKDLSNILVELEPKGPADKED
jgi:hypothetical protein